MEKNVFLKLWHSVAIFESRSMNVQTEGYVCYRAELFSTRLAVVSLVVRSVAFDAKP